MKKYLVVGKPIDHSLSPNLHNYWFRKHEIDATYEKREISLESIPSLIEEIRTGKISGINITVPFKKEFISHLDKLSPEASKTQSVNTLYLEKDKIVGHNTDIEGFVKSLKKINFDISNKNAFILGSGGVVPSIICALNEMNISEISLCNRTKSKAEDLKNLFKKIHIVNWGDIPGFDIIINATSLGLNKSDKINLDFTNIGKNKLFYDVIYNPGETGFLKAGKDLGCRVENGKMMFVYQASASFKIWHGIEPIINEDILKILDK